MFRKKHSISLRPPKTWTEFNGIAEFFTKEYNPESPTDYGTAVGGAISEELALELLIRLWSFGGGLYDQNNHLAIHTPQNMKGMQNFLETIIRKCGSTDVTTDKTFELWKWQNRYDYLFQRICSKNPKEYSQGYHFPDWIQHASRSDTGKLRLASGNFKDYG